MPEFHRRDGHGASVGIVNTNQHLIEEVKSVRIKWRSVGVAGAVAALLSASITPAVNAAELPAEGPEGYYENFDQSGLEAVFVSSEELTGEAAPNGPVLAALDGSAGTFWHSKWQGGAAAAPHTLIFGTTDGPFVDASQIVLTPRGAQGSGRIQNYEVLLSDDAVCTVDSEFESLEKGTVPVTEMGDLTIAFDAQPISCVKLVIADTWNGANKSDTVASLAEFNVAKFIEGERPLPDAAPAPAGTIQKDRPLPAGVISSSEVLNPMALDDRKADNADETPIALRVPSWNGEDRIVGARESTTPAVASLETSGENYFVDCKAESAGADGSKDNPWNSINKVTHMANLLLVTKSYSSAAPSALGFCTHLVQVSPVTTSPLTPTVTLMTHCHALKAVESQRPLIATFQHV